MNHLKRYSFTLVATLSLAGVATAGEIRGIIIKADDTKKELSVDGRGRGVRGAVLKFVLTKDTEIVVDKKPGKVADLVAGKRVHVVFDIDAGQRVARMVTVHAGLGLLNGQAAEAMPAPASADANTVAGLLRRVARTDRELVIISQGAQSKGEIETTVLVPETAKVLRNQKPISFDDLKEDEQAVVQVEKKGRKLYAKTVQVGDAPVMAAGPRPLDQTRIQRIRQILQMIDFGLQQLDRRGP